MTRSQKTLLRGYIENELRDCKLNEIVIIEYERIASAFPTSRLGLKIARDPPYADIRIVRSWALRRGFEVIWEPPVAESYTAPPFEFKKIKVVE